MTCTRSSWRTQRTRCDAPSSSTISTSSNGKYETRTKTRDINEGGHLLRLNCKSFKGATCLCGFYVMKHHIYVWNGIICQKNIGKNAFLYYHVVFLALARVRVIYLWWVKSLCIVVLLLPLYITLVFMLLTWYVEYILDSEWVEFKWLTCKHCC